MTISLNATKLLVLMFGLTPALWAMGGEPGAVMRFGADGRSLAMGSAYVAMADNGTATYWNPANLSAYRSQGVAFLHAQLFEGAQYDFLGYGGLPIGPGVFGSHLLRLSLGGMEKRSADPTQGSLGTFGYAETAGAMGYGLPIDGLVPHTTLGIAGHFMNRSLDGYTSQLYGGDLGARFEPWEPVVLAMSFKNVLRFHHGETEDVLPRKLRLGIAAQPFKGLILSADTENVNRFFFGGEYRMGFLAVRGGWADSMPTFGAGMFWKTVSLDYAYANPSDLGASHRFSLHYRFRASKGKLEGSRSVLTYPHSELETDDTGLSMDWASRKKKAPQPKPAPDPVY